MLNTSAYHKLNFFQINLRDFQFFYQKIIQNFFNLHREMKILVQATSQKPSNEKCHSFVSRHHSVPEYLSELDYLKEDVPARSPYRQQSRDTIKETQNSSTIDTTRPRVTPAVMSLRIQISHWRWDLLHKILRRRKKKIKKKNYLEAKNTQLDVKLSFLFFWYRSRDIQSRYESFHGDIQSRNWFLLWMFVCWLLHMSKKNWMKNLSNVKRAKMIFLLALKRKFSPL